LATISDEQKDKDDIENKVGKNEEKFEKIMLKLKKKILVSDLLRI